MMPRIVLACAVAPMGVAACAMHKVDTNPPPPIQVPKSFVQPRTDPLPEKWWTEFNDKQLDRIVERGLSGNLQLRGAWARLRQARALAKQAASGKWPQVTADASASYRSDFRIGGAPLPDMFEIDNFEYSASISAAYEVDVWKRVGSQASAAIRDAQAMRDDAEAIAMSIAAELAEAWFEVTFRHAQLAIVDKQLKTNQTLLELVQLRFRRGVASALEVHQQRQLLVSTQAQVSLIEAAKAVGQHRIAALIGQPPGTLVIKSEKQLPKLPKLPGTGVPADLLTRRPDVRAAQRRAISADYRVASAVADRLPSLRLTGSAREQSTRIAGLFVTPIFNLIAALSAPLVDGGRRRAEVERTRGVVDERLAAYGQSVLQAITEVESALVQDQNQSKHISELEEQLTVAQALEREAAARYRAGLVDYLTVLTSVQGKQQVELSLLQAQRQALSFRVQLCRALGGTWMRKLKPHTRGKS